MAIEIVDLPIKNSDVPSFFVCVPEDNSCFVWKGCHSGSGTKKAIQPTEFAAF